MGNGIRWYPAVLAFLLLIGTVVSFFAAAQRLALEAGSRRVELAVPYEEVEALARVARRQPEEVFKLLRAEGLTAVFFRERTVEEGEKNGEFTVVHGRELDILARAGGWEEVLRKEKVGGADTCFLTGDEDFAQKLSEQLRIKTGDGRFLSLPGVYAAVTSAKAEDLAGVGLGFPSGPFLESARAGLRAIVQIRYWPVAKKEDLEGALTPLKEVDNLAAVCFDGPALPGYPHLLPDLARILRELNVPLLAVEFQPQKGLAEAGALLNYKVARLHATRPEKEEPLSLDQLRHRLLLAASERNVRVLLISIRTDPADPLGANLRLIATLREDLEKKGLVFGSLEVPAPLAPSRWITFFAGLGVISGGLLFLRSAGFTRCEPWPGVVLATLWGGAAAFAPPAAAKAAAFAAAVCFPVWALRLSVGKRGSALGKSVFLFLRATAVSLLGALLITGLLADTRFMIKLDQFAGVKAAYLLPLVFVAFVFFGEEAREREGGFTDYTSRLLNRPVLWKWAAAALLLTVALVFYVLRSGTQEIIPPPALELKARTLLDQFLLVRPRTKEFLIGHPFLLLLLYTGYRDVRYMPLLLAGAIGQISVVNTFCHVHTPLFISGLRTFHGLWLGILGGLLLIYLWKLALSRGRPQGEDPGTEEERK
ncbi:MAG: DUF5693 family protein [Firmicutes bacterium]|nr:DUF5693 family protein [Bacillota bacterium]